MTEAAAATRGADRDADADARAARARRGAMGRYARDERDAIATALGVVNLPAPGATTTAAMGPTWRKKSS